MDDIQIGSFVSPGQAAGSGWIRLGKDVEIVRETPCYWVDSTGGWWSKTTLRSSPQSLTGLKICAVRTTP
jgi:hypothetical protein